jgi:hypothetical protein
MFSPMVPTASLIDLGHRLVAARVLGGSDQLGLAVMGERDLADIADELLELFVAGDEVGFRIDLDDSGFAHAGINADQTLGSGAPGLLVGLRNALLAQPVDGLVHIAVGLVQRRLAIHHARAGQVAEFFDLCS